MRKRTRTRTLMFDKIVVDGKGADAILIEGARAKNHSVGWHRQSKAGMAIYDSLTIHEVSKLDELVPATTTTEDGRKVTSVSISGTRADGSTFRIVFFMKE